MKRDIQVIGYQKHVPSIVQHSDYEMALVDEVYIN